MTFLGKRGAFLLLIAAFGVLCGGAWIVSRTSVKSDAARTIDVANPSAAQMLSSLSQKQRELVEKQTEEIEREFLLHMFYYRNNLTTDVEALERFVKEAEAFDPSRPTTQEELRAAGSMGLLSATLGRHKEIPGLRDRMIRAALNVAKSRDETTQTPALTLLRLIESDPSGKGLPPDAEKVVEQLSARGFIKMTSDRQIEIYTAPAK